MITKQDFRIAPAGHGHYKVTYTSPKTGRIKVGVIDDMELIDAVRIDYPKKKDLLALKGKLV